jgi:hypothetical protein
MKTRKSHRRAALAAVLGLAAAGGVLASAASLNVSGSSLGAGTTLIASCDTDGVHIKYTTAYDDASSAFRVTKLTVTDLDPACYNKKISVTLQNSTGTSVGYTDPYIIDDVAIASTVTGNPLVESVTGAAVVIND